MNMKSYINVTPQLRHELMAKFNKTRRSVYNALAYITAGDEPEAIRAYALAHGGKYTEENFIPNCNTQHEGELIIQTFPCSVVVVVDTVASAAEIMKDGSIVESFEHVTLRGWTGILAKAQDMSDKAIKASVRL